MLLQAGQHISSQYIGLGDARVLGRLLMPGMQKPQGHAQLALLLQQLRQRQTQASHLRIIIGPDLQNPAQQLKTGLLFAGLQQVHEDARDESAQLFACLELQQQVYVGALLLVTGTRRLGAKTQDASCLVVITLAQPDPKTCQLWIQSRRPPGPRRALRPVQFGQHQQLDHS